MVDVWERVPFVQSILGLNSFKKGYPKTIQSCPKLVVDGSNLDFESTFMGNLSSLVMGPIDVMNRAGCFQWFGGEVKPRHCPVVQEAFHGSTVNKGFFGLLRSRQNQLYFQSISFGREYLTFVCYLGCNRQHRCF